MSDTMKNCYIIGAAPGTLPPLSPDAEDLVIAADGGLAAAAAAGISVDLAVGDFDSLGRVPAELPYLRHPVEKDDTDTALALREGMARGCERFFLFGCCGGRPDHTYANQLALAEAAMAGAEAWLFDANFAVTVLSPGCLRFQPQDRGTVSVFAFGGAADGVCEKGLYYTLKDARLTPMMPLGVSNARTGAPAEISLREGLLLVYAELCGADPVAYVKRVERERWM